MNLLQKLQKRKKNHQSPFNGSRQAISPLEDICKDVLFLYQLRFTIFKIGLYCHKGKYKEFRMIDVTIPTLCKGPKGHFAYLLDHLHSSPFIKNIFIFDNSLGSFNVSDYSKNTEKIKVFNKRNMYVNPAWNSGILLSHKTKSKYHLILNDDILVHERVVGFIYDYMESNPHMDILTVHSIDGLSIYQYEKKLLEMSHKKVKIKTSENRTRKYRNFGPFLFARVSSWVPIDSRLTLFFGDNWLWHSLKHKVSIQSPVITSHVKSDAIMRDMGRGVGSTSKDFSTGREGRIFEQIRIENNWLNT